MIDKSNHTKVGKALYLRFSPDSWVRTSCKNDVFGEPIEVGRIYKPVECSVPIHIVGVVQGDYECVCEFGTEIHEQGD